MKQAEGVLRIDVGCAFGPILSHLLAGVESPKDVQVAYDGIPTLRWSGTTSCGRIIAPTEQMARERCVCAERYGRHAAVPGSLVLRTLVPLVAVKFTMFLLEKVGEDEFAQIILRNAEETDPQICHSHDFCDANMVMADAIESASGIDVEAEDLVNDEVLLQLWNSAWDMAKIIFIPNFKLADQLNASFAGTGSFPFELLVGIEVDNDDLMQAVAPSNIQSP